MSNLKTWKCIRFQQLWNVLIKSVHNSSTSLKSYVLYVCLLVRNVKLGLLKKHKNYVQFALLGFQVAWKLEWVNVNDFMGNGRWMESRKLAGHGWNPLYMWRFLAALSAVCHACFGLIKTYLRRSLGFCWISLTLIALELHSEQSPQRAYGCGMKAPHSKHAVILRVESLIHMSEKTKLHLNKRDTYQPRLFHSVMLILWLNLWVFKLSHAKQVLKMMNKMNGLILFKTNTLSFVVYLGTWSQFPLVKAK